MLVLPSDVGSGLEGLSGCPLPSHGEGRGGAGCLQARTHEHMLSRAAESRGAPLQELSGEGNTGPGMVTGRQI